MAPTKGESVARAEAAVRNLIDEHQLTALPVDPEKVAASLGAIVIHQPGPIELSGILLRRNGQDVIGVGTDLEAARQRFALAHLVGHLHLHARRDLILDTATRYSHPKLASMPTDREEAEANRFAAALLVPEGIVRRMAVEADARTEDQMLDLLAPRFEVTRALMAARLMGLGIISGA